MSQHEPSVTHADAAPDGEQSALDQLAADYFADAEREDLLPGQMLPEDFGPDDEADEHEHWTHSLDVSAIPVLADQRDRVVIGGVRHHVRSHAAEVESRRGMADARRRLVERVEDFHKVDLRGARLAFRGLTSTTEAGTTILRGEVCVLSRDDGGPRVAPTSEQGRLARSRGERRPRREVVADLRERLRDDPSDLYAEALILALEVR